MSEAIFFALWAALFWGHGYTRGRMHAGEMQALLRRSQAYMQGRRDERADQQKEAL